jgi:hypothetical protein
VPRGLAKGACFSSTFLYPERVASNLDAVNRFAADNGHRSNGSCAWSSLRFLQHQDLPSNQREQGHPEVVWFCQSAQASHEFTPALKSLMGDVQIPVNHAFSVNEQALFHSRYEASADRFISLFPELYESFSTLIRYVIFAKRDGYSGGTVSSRIGLIWLSPTTEWSDDEWLENLIHELVHNALFLEDLVHSIFSVGSSRLQQPDALALSAIRQVKRGYDKSYHSAFVSQTLIEYYLAIEKPEKAITFVYPLIICLDDLRKNTLLVSEHGKELLINLSRNALDKYSALTKVDSALS